MFLVLVMALGLFPISAFAASSTIGGALGEVNITNGGYKMSYLSMNGVVRSQSYTYFNFKSASGAIKEIPAYCINPTTKGVGQSRREYQVYCQRSQQRPEDRRHHRQWLPPSWSV